MIGVIIWSLFGVFIIGLGIKDMVFRIQHGTERAEEWLWDVSLSRSREYARYTDVL